jgi:pyruvate,water dikinase
VVEETRGDKRVSAWLGAAGGTVEREEHRPAERTLSYAQLRELTGVISRIEALYGMPVDVEWAFADGALHVLQARPITTYVPLPPEMVTRPGERRQVYGDAALSKGMTTNAPISPLGLDNMESMFSGIVASWVGPLKRDAPPKDSLFFFAGGRMYINYSNVLLLASPAMLAKGTAATDVLMARILGSIDPKQYRALARPPWMSLRVLKVVPRALWHLRGFAWNMARTFVSPERAYRVYRRRVDAFERELREQLDGGLPLEEFRRIYQSRLAGEIFEVAMPAFVAGTLPLGGVIGARRPGHKGLADALSAGATDNVVVEMGISLRRLAALLEPGDWRDPELLARRIEQRRMPPAFLEAWDRFLAAFGWRGPLETDVASPRYADDPRLALRQMACMSVDDDRFDPEVAHRRLVEERKMAYEALTRSVGPVRRLLLRRMYRLIDLFAGARDTPKHLVVLFNYAVRKRALAEGHRLAREGRIDRAEDVFFLTFEELKAASKDDGLDLRAAFAERRRFRERLAQVTRFPAAIDSRGRILRPPRGADTPGTWSGMPVSPGVARGPVKILHTPHEKRVEKGDVLVAYTTDPGWTPLFVNAAAIVLEVGGALQHGAVVAREYGKPCVVGIDQVVATLQEGSLVEVDGAMGTVRLLPSP